MLFKFQDFHAHTYFRDLDRDKYVYFTFNEPVTAKYIFIQAIQDCGRCRMEAREMRVLEGTLWSGKME